MYKRQTFLWSRSVGSSLRSNVPRIGGSGVVLDRAEFSAVPLNHVIVVVPITDVIPLHYVPWRLSIYSVFLITNKRDLVGIHLGSTLKIGRLNFPSLVFHLCEATVEQ